MAVVRRPDPDTQNLLEAVLVPSHQFDVPVARFEEQESSICTPRRSPEGSRRTGTDGASHAILPSVADLPILAARLEETPAEEIVAWALKLFGSGLSLAVSFQNCVLIDIATQIDAQVEILFLDTGSHFPETLAFVEEVRALYDLNLRVIMPGVDAAAWPCGSERCCELRKVAPLDAALTGRAAWMSGLKRVDTPARATVPVVAWDAPRRLVKVNPLARWSYDDVTRYETEHSLPVHPLKSEHYISIGCSPTTRPVSPLEDPRAGRWPGTNQTECGLHST